MQNAFILVLTFFISDALLAKVVTSYSSGVVFGVVGSRYTAASREKVGDSIGVVTNTVF